MIVKRKESNNVILSKQAEEILYDIMIDIENLKKHNVEIEAISVSPYLVSFPEEKEIARIAGVNLESYRWFENKVDKYVLFTSVIKRDKLYNPKEESL